MYDELGGVVASLASGEYPAGLEVSWDVKSLPSGIYTYQLEAGRYLEAKKLILMR